MHRIGIKNMYLLAVLEIILPTILEFPTHIFFEILLYVIYFHQTYFLHMTYFIAQNILLQNLFPYELFKFYKWIDPAEIYLFILNAAMEFLPISFHDSLLTYAKSKNSMKD